MVCNIYDTQMNTWTHIEDFAIGWEKIRMIAIGDLMYIGTGDGSGGNQIYTFDLFTLEVTLVPGRGLQRVAEAAFAVLDGQLVVIAGEEAAGETLITNVYILRD